MLKWHKNYYRGASIKSISKIRCETHSGKPVPGIYLITLSDNPHNHSGNPAGSDTCSRKQQPRICPEIVGIAKGKDESSWNLLQMMVQTIYEETGDILM
ncbi:MAG: hypothetical protein ACLRVD_00685 [Blautia caecimuris]